MLAAVAGPDVTLLSAVDSAAPHGVPGGVAVYRRIWSTLGAVLSMAGAAIGLVVAPGIAVMLALTCAVAVAVVVALDRTSDRPDASARPALGRMVRIGAVAGVVVLATIGSSVVLGPAALLLVPLFAATSPAAVGWYGRALRRSGDTAESTEPQREPVSTAQLCREWQQSYESLRRAGTASSRLRIVEARQRCLDELERRDPAGVAAWLEASASAAGDPSRYLTHGP